MADAELVLLDIADLDEHPENPRIRRDDVVDMIAASMNGEFPKDHAIKVRPIGDRYQIVSGHHRYWACQKKAVAKVWAFVSDMTDEDAYMALATCNAQGEMDAIEYAVHIYRAVEKATAGRGRKGGLSEYAKAIGRTRQWASTLEPVGKVASKMVSQLTNLRGRAEHLKHVAKSDESLWPVLVDCMTAKDWTVKETSEWVEKVAAFDIKEKWREIFLPLDKVVRRFIEKEFSPQTVAKLEAQAEATIQLVSDTEHLSDTQKEKLTSEYIEWLSGGIEGDSWDIRRLIEQHKEIENKLAASPVESWHQGDWRTFVDDIEDKSIACLLTDPPYGMAFKSNRRKTTHKAIENDATEEDATAEIAAMLAAFMPKLSDNAVVWMFCGWQTEPAIRATIEAAGLTIRSRGIWAKNNHGSGDIMGALAPQHETIIHATNGKPTLYSRRSDVFSFAKCDSDRHPTEKPTDLLETLIEASTVNGDTIADPFGGVGSTLVAAKSLDRSYWGCELDEGYHATGKARLLGEQK